MQNYYNLGETKLKDVWLVNYLPSDKTQTE